MTGYLKTSLNKLINTLGEDRVKTILSSFSCPLNKDVEYFLHKNAIIFDKQGVSKTHLIFASYKGESKLAGYFTLANKTITIGKIPTLSKSMRKKINKFATFNQEFKIYHISAPLIAQLGKNYATGCKELITGDELLKIACDDVQESQRIIGGKFVYLECEDKPKLLDFYESNGFVNMGKRRLDKDETELMSGDYLIQMLKYFKG